jgi:hypothetical protein
MNNMITMSDIAFGVTFLMVVGALMLLGCIMVAFIIVGTVVYNMQNGWPLRESVRRALKEWP